MAASEIRQSFPRDRARRRMQGRLRLAMAAFLGLAPIRTLLAGAVVTDGTVGHAGAISGPNFNIGANLGTQVGPNLFHSFSTFNLDAGETASFTGPSSVGNVIARVTGGAPSSINGTIQVQIPNANFYFINPAGVIFGQNASLDVSGSVVVTTASYLKMKDGARFSAASPGTSVLSSAAPAAFGFLSSNPGAIGVATSPAAPLAAPAGKTLSLIGGPVEIINGAISAPGGRVNLVSVAGPGELTFDATSLLASIDLTPGQPQLGQVYLSSSGVNASGVGGGRISVLADSLQLLTSSFFAQTSGATDGLGVDVHLTGAATFSPAVINTGTFGSGKAGPISITASSVTIDGSALPAVSTGISAASSGSGRAGDITFNVGSFSLLGGSGVVSSPFAAGDGGTISIHASGDVKIDAMGNTSSLLSASFGDGRAGDISVQAATLELSHGGTMNASALAGGAAGNITLTANAISIDNVGGTGANRGVLADAFAAATGNAGNIVISASAISVTDGSLITASTHGVAPAGSITVHGGDITLDRANSTQFTGLFATSLSASNGGAAGVISVDGASLHITNGAVISADTNGQANAGSIAVTVPNIVIDGQASQSVSPLPTGLTASSLSGSTGSGNGGQITVSASTVEIRDGGTIAVGSSGSGNAGSIYLSASQTLTLDANGSTAATGIFGDASAGNAASITLVGQTIFLAPGGSISASNFASAAAGTIAITASDSLTIAGGSNANLLTGVFNNNTDGPPGNITIKSPMVTIIGGDVTTGSFGAGQAGTINLDVSSLVLSGSGSFVNAGAFGAGSAGNINISADSVVVGDGGHISSGASDTGNAGTVNVSANTVTVDAGGDHATIDAITQGDGAGGTVTLNAGTLQIFNGGIVAANTQARGPGGTVNVTASNILINGEGSTNNTGIYSESVVPKTGGGNIGVAGNINVQADSVQILNGGAMSVSSAGPSSGGKATVNVTGTLLIDGQTSPISTGIFATSLGAAPAGGVSVTANAINLANFGAISSDANQTGNAGSVTVVANSITMATGAQISSNTFITGAGGNVTVAVAGPLVITGVSNNEVTGITANSTSFGAGGDAGQVNVHAGSIAITSNGYISSDTEGDGHGGNVAVSANTLSLATDGIISSGTFGNGNGGNVTVSATSLKIDGAASQHFTGITAQTDGAGNAGQVKVSGNAVSIVNDGEISSTSFATGLGGRVEVDATNLTLANKSFVDSASVLAGATAGQVVVNVNKDLSLTHSQISSQSIKAGGGDIDIFAGHAITAINSKITAQAGAAGGTVKVVCPGTIDLRHSQILTQAGDNGGNMTVDPSFVILENSTLSANGGENGGNITVRPDWLLQSQSAITATGARGVGGTLQITPDYNLTGALLSLNASLSDTITLAPQCAVDTDQVISSFIVTGRGGVPFTPEGWTPSFDLRLPGNSR